MCIMRTTVSINDSLLDKAKRRARERGLTLGQYLEDAIRNDLARPKQDRPVPPFPIMGGQGGMNPRIDPTSNASMQDFLDEGVPFEKLR